MDEVRLSRLRWRLRGAWQWPLFIAAVPVEAVLLNELPVFGDGAGGLVPGLLLAGFLNLILVAVPAPLLGRLLRRRRPDLPRGVAGDYAGSALIVGALVGLVVAGLLHRPVVQERAGDRRAQLGAVHDYVVSQEPAYEPGLPAADTLELADDLYRTCVPEPAGGRPLCLFVETDQDPPGIRRDDERVPNAAYRATGGFN